MTHLLPRWTLWAALAWVAPTAWAADGAPLSVERVEATDADVAAFEAALARFEARVQEFEADALSAVSEQKTRQVAEIRKMYDARITSLEAKRRDERLAAIGRFEAFLKQYDASALASDVRLRLSELYTQEAQDQFLEALDRYSAAQDAAGADLDALAALESMGEPLKKLTPAAALLERIIADNAGKPVDQQFPLLDIVYYTAAYFYQDENGDLYDLERSRAFLQELVKTRPSSPFSELSHMLLGLGFFEQGDNRAAIGEFNEVIALGPTRKYYDAAVYQRAWAHYRLSEYDAAIQQFEPLLDASYEAVAKGARASDYAQEAVIYLALSLLDQADAEGVAPLTQVNRFFSRRPTKPWAFDVYVQLGRSLQQYARGLDAVDVYDYVLSRPDFSLRPEAVDLQHESINLLSRGLDADLERAGAARLALTERFGDGSAWWKENQDEPEALTRARTYIERGLVEVATELKVRAQTLRRDGAAVAEYSPVYAAAAEKYKEYLDRFPIADDFFYQQTQFADALSRSNQMQAAAVEWEQLYKTRKVHTYGGLAAVGLFDTWLRYVNENVGDLDKTAANAVVDRAYTTPAGKEITVYKLDPAQQELIEAADLLLKGDFGATGEFDAAGYVASNRAALLYIPAQILSRANRFEEARPRLLAVIDSVPSADQAAWSANLLLNSYIAEGDSANVRTWSRVFATRTLGSDASLVSKNQTAFQNNLEASTFALATEAAERGDYLAAAEASLAFVDEFSKSPNAPLALLNAANNYEKIGRADDANRIYERFIRTFPTHPESPRLFLALAENYQSLFQLEKAVATYDELVTRFPSLPNLGDVVYMIAFLKEGMGDALGAAQGYERYAKQFPAAPDREDNHYRAGRMYELVDADKAISFYRGFLAQYGTKNADRTIETLGRIVALQTKKGRTKEASAALDELVATFNRLKAAGGTLSPASHDLAASGALRPLQARHDKILTAVFPSAETAKVRKVLDGVAADVLALTDEVVAFRDTYNLAFEGQSAAFFLLGDAQMFEAKLGLSVQPPPELEGDDLDAFWELLEERFYPEFRQKEQDAVEGWKGILDFAAAAERNSIWVDRTREALNAYDPKQFRAGKKGLAARLNVEPPPAPSPLSTWPVAPAAGEGTP